ncbi:hypothetical protein Vafri_2644 [Volvox africanus]|uniref:PDZ domain-containing protein n=1 Tax=Volvox africanus TaxID=51714 RepID=A0A8J4AUF2_9CHLO|nr:hypothetical protein Vafri_2644 [Volvox africanus]
MQLSRAIGWAASSRSALHGQRYAPATCARAAWRQRRRLWAFRVAAEATDSRPHLIMLTLRKPVGLVFEQKPEGGPVYVAEVVEGGAAARTGKVLPGDILSKCSAVVLKAGKEGLYEAEGYGQRPYDNWEVIEYDCEGKDFKTVMTALRSNNERWGKMDVTLVLRRP